MFAEHGHGEGGSGRRGGRGFGPGRGFGRPGGWQQADLPSADDAAAWLAGRLPADWFEGAPSVRVDREEILVIGTLADPAIEGDEAAQGAARAGRVSLFRESTRDARIVIAGEAEARYQRKLSWGVNSGGEELMFTHLAAPVMTRLRQPDRQVLDTLVDAGVARSRADALSWCVRLVGEHADEWLGGLRNAMSEVDKLRQEGPSI
jgi:hypothetical protein